MEFIVIMVVWAAIGGLVGLFVGDLGNKHNGTTGAILGALLGPIGWLIAAVLPPSPEADVAKPSPESERIKALEQQLAQMRQQDSGRKKTPMPGRRSEDGRGDGEIPTYRLD